jgi:hypothetical protein
MKTKVILLIAIILFLVGGMGCENDNLSYQGKIISLNSGSGCFNIVEISKSIPQGLSVNSTITFDPRLYNGQLKVGDIVYFKIIKYEAWTPEPMVALCSAPQYVGQLEFYAK